MFPPLLYSEMTILHTRAGIDIGIILNVLGKQHKFSLVSRVKLIDL